MRKGAGGRDRVLAWDRRRTAGATGGQVDMVMGLG